MTEIYCYLADLPANINEMVATCPDGYTIYINSRLSDDARRRAYVHALAHIKNNDWSKDNADLIELSAHMVENVQSDTERQDPFF